MPPTTDTITRTAVADAVVRRELEGKDEDTEMLRVPISSTRADRENDEFSKEALEGMADQIRRDQPMVFDNHGLAGAGFWDAIPYDSRETIGAQMDAEVAEDGDDADLYAYVNPDGTHPEGERMLKQVRDEGQPIKFSVGFKVQNADEKTDDAGNEIGRVFTNADLMETSRVGIPANPDASVTQAVNDVGAKEAAQAGLPGYQNHPILRMLQAASPEQGETVAKSVDPGETDSEDPDPLKELTEEVRELRAELDTIKEESTKEEDEDDEKECTVDTDCPEGEVCLEGECVPEEEVDDDDDDDGEEDSTEPDEIEELRQEIAELRESGLERGDSKTTSTDMEQKDIPEDTDTASVDDEGEQTQKNEDSEPSPDDWLNTN